MAKATAWTTNVALSIRPLTAVDVPLFDEHFARHRGESGRGDYHFMPFAPNDEDGPKGLDARLFELPLTTPGWQRWWVAWSPDPLSSDRGQIVGHVDLKGDHLKAGLHRCELGVGIERDHRGRGLGAELMEVAIEFTRTAENIDWLDLRVFGHNANARALYMKLGFMEIGRVTDCFRIEGESLDDVMMTLDVSSGSSLT